MDIESLREYCLAKNKATEGFPFDKNTLVFKVLGKMFALFPLDKWDKGEASVMLKCDPERTVELREQYEEVRPGFHMNKKHWNTVSFEGSLEEDLLCELIDHSYDLVVKGLRKKDRALLEELD